MKHIKKAWVSVFLIALLVVIVYLLFIHKTTVKPDDITPPVQSPVSQPSPKPLTAGNITVPEKSRAKAQSLGYYCPSWDAPANSVTPQVCTPLDK